MTSRIEIERPRYIDPDLRESGDLADYLLAILSHASVAGVSEIREKDLFRMMAWLEQEYLHLIPNLLMEEWTLQWEGKPYPHFLSHRLGKAIRFASPLGLERLCSDPSYLEVAPEDAERHLEDLRERAGDDFVNSLQPVGVKLADLVKEKQTS